MNAHVPLHLVTTAIGPETDARILEALRRALGAEIVETWLSRLRLDGFALGRAIFSQPTSFLRKWALDRYELHLLRAARLVAPGIDGIDVVVRSSARSGGGPKPKAVAMPIPPRPAGPPKPAPCVQAAPAIIAPVPALRTRTAAAVEYDWGQIDPSARFSTLVEHPDNTTARSACKALCASAATGNPVVLTGPTGIGKSHLAQAAVAELREAGHDVAFFSAVRLEAEFRAGAKAKLLSLFEEPSLVVVDDIHLISASTMGRFLRAILPRRVPLLFTSTKPLFEFEIDEEVGSRLRGGLPLMMPRPGVEARRAILARLEMRAAETRPNFWLASDIRDAIADTASGDVRELISAMMRLALQFDLGSMPATVAEALAMLPDLGANKPARPVSINDIQKLVAERFGVKTNDLLSHRRTKNVVMPRQIAMFLAKEMTTRSLPEIGRRFANRDHTTVLHAVRKIESLRGVDPVMAADIANLRAGLEAR